MKSPVFIANALLVAVAVIVAIVVILAITKINAFLKDTATTLTTESELDDAWVALGAKKASAVSWLKYSWLAFLLISVNAVVAIGVSQYEYASAVIAGVIQATLIVLLAVLVWKADSAVLGNSATAPDFSGGISAWNATARHVELFQVARLGLFVILAHCAAGAIYAIYTIVNGPSKKSEHSATSSGKTASEGKALVDSKVPGAGRQAQHASSDYWNALARTSGSH